MSADPRERCHRCGLSLFESLLIFGAHYAWSTGLRLCRPCGEKHEKAMAALDETLSGRLPALDREK